MKDGTEVLYAMELNTKSQAFNLQTQELSSGAAAGQRLVLLLVKKLVLLMVKKLVLAVVGACLGASHADHNDVM